MQPLLPLLLHLVKPILLSLENHQITLLLLLNTGHNPMPPLPLYCSGGTDTVIIREPPNHTVTTTEYWSQSMPPLPLLLLLQVVPIPFLSEPPNHTVTTTEYWSQSYATTTTVTTRWYRYRSYQRATNHTVLLLNTGHNHATTTTVTAPPGTDTVIIREPPNHTVTTTEYWSQSFATTTTVTALTRWH